MVEIESQNIVAGDILFLRKNERVPVDVLLLKTMLGDGTAYVKTDQLDGETDWKVREAIKTTNDFTQEEI